MNNFLKSECYKVSHRAYPYTLLIIGVVIAILINVSVWYAIHVIRIPFTIEGADIMNAGLYMMATIVWYCIIFTTDIGFSGEWRNNTMKNIVSFGTSRNTIFFGKCIVNTLLLLIGIVVVSAAYLLTNYICFRHDGSLTASAYQNYFLRFVIMLPMIIAGQTMASSLCMFFSTDLLWCGIYAVVVALLPNGIMLFYAIFPEVEALRIIYTNLPTVRSASIRPNQLFMLMPAGLWRKKPWSCIAWQLTRPCAAAVPAPNCCSRLKRSLSAWDCVI